MLRCNICNKRFEGTGYDPFPLVRVNDLDSRCCSDCYHNEVKKAEKELRSSGKTPIEFYSDYLKNKR